VGTKGNCSRGNRRAFAGLEGALRAPPDPVGTAP